MYIETTLVNINTPTLVILRRLQQLANSGNTLFDLQIAESILPYFKDRMQEDKDGGNVCAQCAANYLAEARIAIEEMEKRIKPFINN